VIVCGIRSSERGPIRRRLAASGKVLAADMNPFAVLGAPHMLDE
jgi:hypothetical protein